VIRTVVLSEAEADAVFDVPPRKKKKPGTGSTAMKHARAVVAERWPGLPTLEAQKSVIWIPDKKDTERRMPISRREDLFAAFDILVPAHPLQLIQVTTQQERGQTVTARKRKIEENFLAPYREAVAAAHIDCFPPELSVWSWVARAHFFAWSWCWKTRMWGTRYCISSPALSRKSR